MKTFYFYSRMSVFSFSAIIPFTRPWDVCGVCAERSWRRRYIYILFACENVCSVNGGEPGFACYTSFISLLHHSFSNSCFVHLRSHLKPISTNLLKKRCVRMLELRKCWFVITASTGKREKSAWSHSFYVKGSFSRLTCSPPCLFGC